MTQVNIKLVHVIFRRFYLLLSLFCILGWFILVGWGTTLELRLNLFNFSLMELVYALDLSLISLLFMGIVSLITSVVLVFSFSYMGSHYHSLMFLIMLNLFVASMLCVISFKSIFMVMLGWDGLGVISFFLDSVLSITLQCFFGVVYNSYKPSWRWFLDFIYCVIDI